MLKKKLKNLLLGGDDNPNLNPNLNGIYSLSVNKQLQVLLSIIIIGYFGVKIVYGFFFKFYPDKYYFQNIDINSTLDDKDDQNSEEKREYQKKMAKNITLNAYVPGMWNNEMTDFITAITLTFIIFVFTNITTKSIISQYGNIHPSFLFGYIIGLGYPPIYYNYSNFFSEEFRKNCIIQYLYLAIMVCFIIFLVLLNYHSANVTKQENKMNYIIYVVSIILVIFGLIYSKKNVESYNSVTYFYRNQQKCMKKESEPGVVKSSGDVVNLNTSFMVFIILLLFSFEPQSTSMKYLYMFMYGFLIGIFISAISYYGIEFFLIKQPQKECIGEDECRQDLMPIIPLEEENKIEWETNKNLDNNPTAKLNKPSFHAISSIKMFFIILILLVFIYLIYHYVIKQS